MVYIVVGSNRTFKIFLLHTGIAALYDLYHLGAV